MIFLFLDFFIFPLSKLTEKSKESSKGENRLSTEFLQQESRQKKERRGGIIES